MDFTSPCCIRFLFLFECANVRATIQRLCQLSLPRNNEDNTHEQALRIYAATYSLQCVTLMHNVRCTFAYQCTMFRMNYVLNTFFMLPFVVCSFCFRFHPLSAFCTPTPFADSERRKRFGSVYT